MHKISHQQPSIPLSLYIHIPWCTKKCPYCDFNSYASPNIIPEKAYIQRLMMDLEQDKPLIQGRSFQSIFFGGGTPSLFSPKGIEAILEGVKNHLMIDTQAEITLEANPGTVSLENLKDYQKPVLTAYHWGHKVFKISHYWLWVGFIVLAKHNKPSRPFLKPVLKVLILI